LAAQQLTNKDATKYNTLTTVGGKECLDVNLAGGDIQIGAVEIKNGTDDTRAVVKSDGTNNALVVTQNSVPTTTVTATDLDIRNLSRTTDSVKSEITGLNVSAGTYQEVNVIDTGVYKSLFVTPIDPSGIPVTILSNGDDALANNHNEEIVAGFTYYFNGTTWDRARGDTTNGMLVNLGSNNDVTASITGFIIDTDDSSIAKNQVLPLNINENYIFSKTADAWVRQEGTDTGYSFTRIMGIYTPNGQSVLNDDNDSMVVSGTVAVTGTFWQTTQPVSATNLDIRDIDWASDDIKSYAADECQRILTSDDAVTTINYATAAKASVSNIVTSSVGLGRKVTDTYDNSGVTTLVLTRVVANV
jgi:hypothetical protein